MPRTSGPLPMFFRPFGSFKFSILTTAPNETFTLPLLYGNANFIINWGDETSSNITSYNDPDITHTYTSAGTYEITMTGICTGFAFNADGDCLKVIELLEFVGDMGFKKLRFDGCTNLTTIDSSISNLKSLTTADWMFQTCSSLTSIPSGMFDGSTGILTFQETFRDTSITSIPTDLFKYNTAAIGFDLTFVNCPITSLPIDLFRYNILVTSFNQPFSGCSISSLPAGFIGSNVNVDISNMLDWTAISELDSNTFKYFTGAITAFINLFFNNTILTTIPAGLFDYNVNVTSFATTFYNCTSLTSIPSGIFDNNILITDFTSTFENCVALTGNIPVDLFKYNTAVTTFAATFSECVALTGAIPTDLFRYNTLVTDFSYTFCRCLLLTFLPVTLFDNNTLVTTFVQTFYTDELLDGTAPELWLRDPEPLGDNCFETCTGLDNYASIPNDWKGL